MTPVFFYHLERQPLESVLPKLLTASLERGWRAVVQAGSDERAEALAALLWTYDEESFLPHGTKADGTPGLQPIWLTAGGENPNGAAVQFLVDGAEASEIDGFVRVVILFDGRDADALERARAGWRRFKSEGREVTYWQQDENGRWQNRAA